jgi:serine/threonine protein kinase
VSAVPPILPLCETPDDSLAIQALSRNPRYAVVRRLGSGSFSTVFLACDRARGDAPVAIKVVSNTKVSRSEMLAGALLRGHRDVACMIDWFQDREHYFLAFEYVNGPDLQVMWAGLPATKAFFGERHFRRVFLCVLDALAFCHERGVVHRDVKMENVVVCDEGRSACLVDFGFAFLVRPPRVLMAAAAAAAISSSLPPRPPRGARDRRDADAAPTPRGHAVVVVDRRDESVGSDNEDRSDGDGDGPEAEYGADRSPPPPLMRPLPDCIYRRDPMTGALAALRMDTPDVLTPANLFVGTDDYCAPEVTLGAVVEPDDLFATDVYSLGVLLHVALTDRFPQQAPFARFLAEARHRLMRPPWSECGDPRLVFRDAGFVAEINRRGAPDLADAHGLSAEARDLLVRMLKPVPHERISLADVRRHPWVVAGRRHHRRGR